MEKREPYWDYMGRRLREERYKGGGMVDRAVAEAEIANELEKLRTKGGRRSIPIPKQF